jgi:hypothetical protein
MNQIRFINDKTVYIFFDPSRPDFMQNQQKLRDVFLEAGWEYKDAHRERNNKLTSVGENHFSYYWELVKK